MRFTLHSSGVQCSAYDHRPGEIPPAPRRRSFRARLVVDIGEESERAPTTCIGTSAHGPAAFGRSRSGPEKRSRSQRRDSDYGDDQTRAGAHPSPLHRYVQRGHSVRFSDIMRPAQGRPELPAPPSPCIMFHVKQGRANVGTTTVWQGTPGCCVPRQPTTVPRALDPRPAPSGGVSSPASSEAAEHTRTPANRLSP